MALAADDGVDELSMRGRPSSLGVGAMSLYTYVPGKDELFELMIDRAWATRGLPGPRPGLAAAGRVPRPRGAGAMYRTHPWLMHSNLWRMPLGPHVLDAQEDLYRAVSTGLDGARREVVGLVESTCSARPARRHRHRRAARTGVTQDEYWAVARRLLGHLYSSERFPTMTGARRRAASTPSTGQRVRSSASP